MVLAVVEAIKGLTGLRVVWKDREPDDHFGLPLRVSRHFNPYCQGVQRLRPRVRLCVHDDVLALRRRATIERKPFVKTCHAGVTERVVPIFEYGHFFGNFFIGPVRLPGAECPYVDASEEFRKLRVWDEDLMGQVTAILMPIAEHIGLAFTELPVPLPSKSIDPRIGAALSFMREQLAGRPTAGMVAGHVHLSTSRFLHLFSEEAGQTFSEALTHIRLHHARRLLASSDLDMSSIAARCGYANQNYFASVFRRQMNCTPTQYRRQQTAGLRA